MKAKKTVDLSDTEDFTEKRQARKPYKRKQKNFSPQIAAIAFESRKKNRKRTEKLASFLFRGSNSKKRANTKKLRRIAVDRKISTRKSSKKKISITRDIPTNRHRNLRQI